MIRKLKFKFIIMSSTALLIMMTIIVTVMNLLNYASVVNEADDILELLSHNRGSFPGFGGPEPNRGDRLPIHMSPELPYESRYFSVLLDVEKNVIYTDISRIVSVSADEAAEHAVYALSKSDERGFSGQFRFYRYSEGDTTRIIFLDCGRKLDVYLNFLTISVTIALGGYLLVFILICFISARIIRPIAESYEKQKRFITDAGHEIKTPLTVIAANVDLLELETGDNESINDIRQQTERLTRLTNDLVFLSRMEEASGSVTMTDFPLSDIVEEVSESFSARIKAENKTVSRNIVPLLFVKGNSKSVEQLISILMDNALKYSPENGELVLELSKQGRSAVISLTNPTAMPIEKDQLTRIFDRFYRLDSSRNSETGGHGIGLSLAKAIVETHGGKINASVDTDGRFCITVSLPTQQPPNFK